MNSNYEYPFMTNSTLQNVYIVCERSAVDLPQFIGSNKLGTPIKAFDNLFDAENFVNEMSIGLRYITVIPFQKNNFQHQVPHIIYNILPQPQPQIQPQIQPQLHPQIQPQIYDYPKLPYPNYNTPSAPLEQTFRMPRQPNIYHDDMNPPRYN
jgi:hypothetical protein